VPELYAEVSAPHQVRHIYNHLRSKERFVVKPSRGSGGKGVMVIDGRMGTYYRKVNGELIDEDDLSFHLNNILSGMYSLGGLPDRAIIEYCVQFDPVFQPVSYLGVPDIRIIVFLGIPVMAMVRMPTRASDGRANLHQGAVGAGVDLATGLTLSAVLRNRIVDRHPDTWAAIAGIQIPGWDQLMTQAAACYEMIGLGYLGVDMVIDRELGPLILELNARPGLSIQIANRQGLLQRLKKVKTLGPIQWSPEERRQFAQSTFGAAVTV
jgi:alpha-L-glutamate ligase-like protein